MSKLRLAKTIAKHFHSGQTYGGKDYFKLHVCGVVKSLKLHNLPEDYMIVGYLHDVVEDTSVETHSIINLFGKTVGEAVDAITKRDGETRKAYLERCKTNKIARVVKLHDAMYNATSCHKNKNKGKHNYYLQTINALQVDLNA